MINTYYINLLSIHVFLVLTLNSVFGQTVDDGLVEWKEVLEQPDDWYASEDAIRVADNVLLYQNDNGGWPKNINMARPLTGSEMSEIIRSKNSKEKPVVETTIDNGATVNQIRYLGRVIKSTGIERFKTGFIKGIDYLLDAQYENGGWPQFYPIRRGYFEHITFNDGAMIGVMYLLKDVSEGKYSFVDTERIDCTRKAISKGLEVILQSQIIVDGKSTAWCAQHHHNSLKPAKARAYELPSISGAESVGIVRYLMSTDTPKEEIVETVCSAIQWFNEVRLENISVIRVEDPGLPKGYDNVVVTDDSITEPLWARFYEIGSNRPIFVGRDGIVKYHLSEIEYERRVGYRWLGDWPKDLIYEDYPAWCKKWKIKCN